MRYPNLVQMCSYGRKESMRLTFEDGRRATCCHVSLIKEAKT